MTNKSTVEDSEELDILPKYKEALLAFSPGIYKYNEKMETILNILIPSKKEKT